MISKLIRTDDKFYHVKRVRGKFKKIMSEGVYLFTFESGEKIIINVGTLLIHQFFLVEDLFEGEIIAYTLPDDNNSKIALETDKLLSQWTTLK